MLRDRLVCGIFDRTVQRRLLQQVDLTFDKALVAALAAEAADKDSRRLISYLSEFRDVCRSFRSPLGASY